MLSFREDHFSDWAWCASKTVAKVVSLVKQYEKFTIKQAHNVEIMSFFHVHINIDSISKRSINVESTLFQCCVLLGVQSP